MAPGPSKCLALGVLTSTNQYIWPEQDLSHNGGQNGNVYALSGTQTPWVRLWIDWPSAQPTPNAFDMSYFAKIEANIAQAKALGLGVILTSHRFPTWANTEPWDPADRGDKQMELRYPSDVSTSSPWAFWIWVLAARYNPVTRPLGSGTYVDVLEVLNEPNLAWWPQLEPSPSTGLKVHRYAAKMMQTAREMTKQTQNAPLLMGPAMSDIKGSNRQRTDYQEFMTALLTRFQQIAFTPDSTVIWSQHNYGDVTYDLGPGTATTTANQLQEPTVNRARWAHQKLVSSGWAGYGASNGYLFLTEGGITTENAKLKYGAVTAQDVENVRASLMYRSFKRMQDATIGAGVLLYTNYLVYGGPNVGEKYDTGLLTPTSVRQPTYDTWSCLPGC
jgi:hypothetical protein